MSPDAPSGAFALAVAVFKGAMATFDMPRIVRLERFAEIRPEAPLVVGSGEKRHLDRGLPLLIDLKDLYLIRGDPITVQRVHQAAYGIGDIGIEFLTALENGDPGLIGIRQTPTSWVNNVGATALP